MVTRGDMENKNDAPTVAIVMRCAAKFYGVRVCDILGYDRSERVRRARQVAMYLARNLCARSTHMLGREFRRDHKSIIRASRAVREDAAADVGAAAEVERVEAAIRQGCS